MQVFLSWSGARSQAVAAALRDWLPLVIQQAKPFYSTEDIDKGARWLPELSGQLKQHDVGIICVTPENLHAPWLLFEAGALSKALEASSVTPLLFGLEPSELKGPLTTFQAARADQKEMYQLICVLNKRAQAPLEQANLDRTFQVMWPLLVEKFGQIAAPESVPSKPKRSSEDILAEVLDRVRRIEHDARDRDFGRWKARNVPSSSLQLISERLFAQEFRDLDDRIRIISFELEQPNSPLTEGAKDQLRGELARLRELRDDKMIRGRDGGD